MLYPKNLGELAAPYNKKQIKAAGSLDRGIIFYFRFLLYLKKNKCLFDDIIIL